MRTTILNSVNLAGQHQLGANLGEATVAQEQLGIAYSLNGAIIPDGAVHD